MDDFRFKRIVIKVAQLLLKIPLETLRLVARFARFLVSKDPEARRQVIVLVLLLGLMAVSRYLVHRASKKRLLAQQKKSVFQLRYKSLLTLTDQDEDDAFEGRMRQIQLPVRRDDGFGEIELSTQSGHTPKSVKQGRMLQSNSAFSQTRYLDDIEQILKKRKRQKHSNAVKFLQQLQVKKSEAFAQNLLKQTTALRIGSSEAERQLHQSREHILKQSIQVQRNADSEASDNGELSPIEEIDDRSVDLKQIKNVDQLFFDFFGMYTAESIRKQKKLSKNTMQ